MSNSILLSVGAVTLCLLFLTACASQIPFNRSDALHRSEQHFGKDSRWIFSEVVSTDRLTDSIQIWVDDVDEDATDLADVLSIPRAKVAVGGAVPAKTHAVVRNALERLAGSPERGSEILIIGPVGNRDPLERAAQEAHVKISFTDT